MEVARFKCYDVVKLLIELGADVNATYFLNTDLRYYESNPLAFEYSFAKTDEAAYYDILNYFYEDLKRIKNDKAII